MATRDSKRERLQQHPANHLESDSSIPISKAVFRFVSSPRITYQFCHGILKSGLRRRHSGRCIDCHPCKCHQICHHNEKESLIRASHSWICDVRTDLYAGGLKRSRRRSNQDAPQGTGRRCEQRRNSPRHWNLSRLWSGIGSACAFHGG